jgi:hypothetical protein
MYGTKRRRRRERRKIIHGTKSAVNKMRQEQKKL